jgi:hypothetical protein
MFKFLPIIFIKYFRHINKKRLNYLPGAGCGRPSPCLSVLNFAALVTIPSKKRLNHDFFDSGLAGCTGAVAGTEPLARFGTVADETLACGTLTSNSFAGSWA